MRRTTRTAAGALTLAVALSAGSPLAATAAGHDTTGHDKASHAKADKGEKADKGSKGAKKAAQELRQVLRDLAKVDERLAKVVREDRIAAIGDHAAAVLANVAADRAALTELATSVQVVDSGLDLREVRKALRDVREQNYNKVVNDLRHALELAAEIEAARVALATDPAAPVADLDAAQLALDAAVAKALLITASSDKDELRAVKADLQAAHQAFEVVSDYLESLAADEPTEDEVVAEEPAEEPVVEEPVEEEPVVEPVVEPGA